MTTRSSAQIRREFIDYFVARCGHTFVPSSPCVPHDDPTLMFTNAGMNQFKPIFLGTVDANSEFGRLKRAVNTQKCIRAGGKHNDLDDVGHDTYHHTFFEMLGNWSFGDYFKKEAIAWAWELLTKVWGLDPKRLHATYFEGDAAEGLDPDTEARDLWRAILPADHVHPGNKKDNFWEMGDTGPCGPCSEIHIDKTPACDGGHLVNAGDARVMEIWNLVFIQFNRGPDNKLTPLPAKHVDTGMGFERICAVVRGTETGRLAEVSNYDTDVFTPIFAAIQRVTGAAKYTGLLEGEAPNQSRDRQGASSGASTAGPASMGGDSRNAVMKDVAYRVVADHIRTLTFAITDGAMPSNEGRGFVLRRILRRAVRYGRQYLGTSKPFMCDLVAAVVDAMGEAFPELRKDPQRVAAIIRDEEASFIKTLDRGIALFDEAAQYAVTHHHGKISGEDAFKLHDTYGFPIDLTELMAEERGLTVNVGEYERLMEAARDRSRIKQVSEFLAIPEDQLSNATEDQDKYAITDRGIDAKYLFSVVVNDHSEGFVFDRTCFYADQGGQVGDTGELRFPSCVLPVINTVRHRNHVLHVVERNSIDEAIPDEQPLAHGCTAKLVVNDTRRSRIASNHTSTHVLNWCLREVLGDHVQQKGSLVDPDKTRFDLSHPAAITNDELRRIEELTNQQIARNLPVQTNDNVPVDQKAAMKIRGLRAVFGEKYPDHVRVVSIGVPVADLLKNPDNAEWMKYSVEFCGGTHVKETGEIKRFRLVEESAVAKGVRRVTGITGEKALAAERAAAELAGEIEAALHAARSPLPDGRGSDITALSAKLNATALPVVEKHALREKLAELQEIAKKLQKEQAKSAAGDIAVRTDELLAGAEKIGATSVICADLGDATADQLRVAADSLRAKAGSASLFLTSRDGGRVVMLAAGTTDVVCQGFHAGNLLKELAPIVGGKGGGRPDIAQGGGPDEAKIPEALEKAKVTMKSRIYG